MAVRSLQIGTHGADVKAVQEALNTWGADPALDPDGDFGNNTDAAVRNFQASQNLDVDGVVGRATRRALFPVGVATTTIVAYRLRLPDPPLFQRRQDFRLGPLLGDRQSLGGDDPFDLGGGLQLAPPPPLLDPPLWSFYALRRFPRLATSLAAPNVSDWSPNLPALPSDPSFQPFGFKFDHIEVQPGGQTTFQFGAARQNAFTLTMQNVYQRGSDDGPNQQIATGVQIGTPVISADTGWTFNPFIQYTDVDRFGALGAFHWWQPYAQAGVQITGLGNPQPSLTGSLFPVNLGVDLNDFLSLSFAGGLAFTMDLNSGQVQAGIQLSTGLTLKLGVPKSPF
jgi:peptidoglycan hydrolase-like protein with peptidoglycan-binding domain